MYGKEGKLPEPKNGEVENWGDFAEKMGIQALEMKSQMEKLFKKMRKNFFL